MEISDLLALSGVYPLWKPSGSADDSATINTALANTSFVSLGPGTWNCKGLTIPPTKKLVLLPNALLKTSGMIQLVTNNSALVGDLHGINAEQNTNFNYNVQWTGAPGGTVIGIGTDGNPAGCLSNVVDGINIYGGGVANVTGLRMGSEGGGCTWAKIRDVGFINLQAGLNVFHGCQGNDFRNLHFWNDVLSTGAAIEIGGDGNPVNGSGCTVNTFYQGIVDGYRYCVKIGGAAAGANGAALVTFYGYTFEMQDTAGKLLLLNQGGLYEFHGCFFEAPGPPNTVIGCQIGDATHVVNDVKFFGGWIQGTFNDGFHLYGFRRFGLYGTTIDASGAAQSRALVNDGSNGIKLLGTWMPAGVVLAELGTEAIGINGANPWDGFEIAYQMNDSLIGGGADAGNRPSMRLGVYKEILCPAGGVVTDLFPTTIRCEFNVINSSNSWAKFYCTGSGAAGLVQMISTTSISTGAFSDTKDTAGKMNIYQDNVTNRVVLQNNLVGSNKVRVRILEDGEAGT